MVKKDEPLPPSIASKMLIIDDKYSIMKVLALRLKPKAQEALRAADESWAVVGIEIICGTCHGSGKEKDSRNNCQKCNGEGRKQINA
jgi:hypothetical protein